MKGFIAAIGLLAVVLALQEPTETALLEHAEPTSLEKAAMYIAPGEETQEYNLDRCNFKLYKQCDPAWGGNHLGTSSTTICKAGCAMSSVAMYLTTRGHSMNPGQLNEWLKSHGGYAQGDLIVWSAVNKLGVSYQGQETGVSNQTLVNGINACHGIIANVRNGGHWVLLTGYDHHSGEFYVNDPGFNQATYPLSQMKRFAVYH